MHLRGVLIEARGDLVLGLLDGHAVHVIDLFASRVVFVEMRGAGQVRIVSAEIKARRNDEILRIHRSREFRRDRFRRWRTRIALVHHHPPAIGHRGLAALVHARRAHMDDAGLAVGVFLQANHFRRRGERVARVDGREETPFRIAEIGDRIQRHIRHRLAEHHVEREQRIDRRARQSAALRERIGREQRITRPRQRRVQRHVPTRHRARRRVADHLPEPEVLEKVAGVGFGAHSSLRKRLREISFEQRRPARPTTSFRQSFQFRPVASHQRFLLGATPPLDLPLSRDSLVVTLEVLGPDQLDGTARVCVGGAVHAGVVLRDACARIVTTVTARIVAAVSAPQDVDEDAHFGAPSSFDRLRMRGLAKPPPPQGLSSSS
ncbi:MAG: hypothetical protein FD124_723 [Alphaproteobacteria bacterium]|nr:MAG: hypothetical protein FD124_723 [Alphaproteobacteria bacterium]